MDDGIARRDGTEVSTAASGDRDPVGPAVGSSGESGERAGRPGSAYAPNHLALPSPSGGGRSQRFVEVAAEEVAALLRESVAPNLWKPVLARAGEMLETDS